MKLTISPSQIKTLQDIIRHQTHQLQQPSDCLPGHSLEELLNLYALLLGPEFTQHTEEITVTGAGPRLVLRASKADIIAQQPAQVLTLATIIVQNEHGDQAVADLGLQLNHHNRLMVRVGYRTPAGKHITNSVSPTFLPVTPTAADPGAQNDDPAT